jgi:hypothetical protein
MRLRFESRWLSNSEFRGVGKGGSRRSRDSFLLRECRSFLFPQAAKFGRPWSGETPFQLENDASDFSSTVIRSTCWLVLRHA